MRTVMRNLFSILCGLLSCLIYGLISVVLFLDRVICAIYDLPLWGKLAHAFRSLARRRAVCACAVFATCFILPAVLLTHGGVVVMAGGRAIGMVESRAVLGTAIATIEEQATALQGSDYVLPCEISCSPSRGTSSQFLNPDELTAALVDSADDLGTLAVISVDGEQAGVCQSPEEAQTLLDRIKSSYTTVANEQAEFLQSVRVDRVIAPTALAADFGTLYQELSPQLDVSSTRSVTYTEEIPYETITRENEEMEQNREATVQPGQAGEAVVTAQILTIDGQERGRTVVERTVLSQATNEIVEIGTKNIGIGTGEFCRPMDNYTFTSAFKWRWGKLHSGVDLAVDEGTPVYAADNGKVILAEDAGDGYGNYIILDHQNGFKTLYAHNSQLLVSVGDVVAKGEQIACSGNSGNSTGPHLHFEVQVNDEKVDPQMYVSLT